MGYALTNKEENGAGMTKGVSSIHLLYRGNQTYVRTEPWVRQQRALDACHVRRPWAVLWCCQACLSWSRPEASIWSNPVRSLTSLTAREREQHEPARRLRRHGGRRLHHLRLPQCGDIQPGHEPSGYQQGHPSTKQRYGGLLGGVLMSFACFTVYIYVVVIVMGNGRLHLISEAT
jgi:hypothetical protein